MPQFTHNKSKTCKISPHYRKLKVAGFKRDGEGNYYGKVERKIALTPCTVKPSGDASHQRVIYSYD